MDIYATEITVAPELDEILLPRHEPNILACEWSCIANDVICLMEFCEAVGPKPILTLPPGLRTPHLNLDDISLMMMTGDAQLNAKLCPGSQNLAQGFMTIEEQGLSLVNMNFLLNDVTARGHVRQFAIAYLSPRSDELRLGYGGISIVLRDLVRHLSACNGAQYKEELAYLLRDYEGKEDEQGMVEAISCNFDEAKSILMKWNDLTCVGNCSGAHSLFSTTEFTVQDRKLRTLADLTSCFYGEFISRLSALLDAISEYTQTEITASTASELPVGSAETKSALWHIQGILPHILFGLYTGHQVVIAGSQMRRQTVSDIVEKLGCLPMPRSPEGTAAMIWNEGDLSLPILDRYSLVGQLLDKNENLLSSRLAQLFYLLDLNQGKFSGILYCGGHLSKLLKRVLAKCSDLCLHRKITSIYSSYWVLAYLLFHILYKDQSSYRMNIHQLSSLCSSLRISGSDLKIIKSFVQTFKADGPTMNGIQESKIMSGNTISVIKL